MTPPGPDLDHWTRTFRGPLIGLLVSRGADWGRAEELAQDTFAEGWLSWSRFQGSPNNLKAAGAWLRGIALRLHGADSRRRRRRRTQELHEDLAADPPPPVDPRLEALDEAIAKLPPGQQEVVRMRYLEDSPPAHVAALLGITKKAVERRLYEARQKLRDHVNRAERVGAAQ